MTSNPPPFTHQPRPTPAVPATPSVAFYADRPDLPAPGGHLFASVCWLVARNPVLHRLACRIPRVVDTDADVLPWVLADAFAAYDSHWDAWAAYSQRRPAPTGYSGDDAVDQARYDAWLAAGPQPADEHRGQVEALGVMSRTEVVRLRLVATSRQQPAGRVRRADARRVRRRRGPARRRLDHRCSGLPR